PSHPRWVGCGPWWPLGEQRPTASRGAQWLATMPDSGTRTEGGASRHETLGANHRYYLFQHLGLSALCATQVARSQQRGHGRFATGERLWRTVEVPPCHVGLHGHKERAARSTQRTSVRAQ